MKPEIRNWNNSINKWSSLESVKSNSSTVTSREIISKTMHDAAFNIAYNHIKPTIILFILDVPKSVLHRRASRGSPGRRTPQYGSIVIGNPLMLSPDFPHFTLYSF